MYWGGGGQKTNIAIFTYDSLHGPYILAKRQKWQIDTAYRLFPCQLYHVTLFLTHTALSTRKLDFEKKLTKIPLHKLLGIWEIWKNMEKSLYEHFKGDTHAGMIFFWKFKPGLSAEGFLLNFLTPEFLGPNLWFFIFFLN